VTQGGSHWGANAHVPALKALARYELGGVCTSRENAQGLGRAFGRRASVPPVQRHGRASEVDLIVVCVLVPGHRSCHGWPASREAGLLRMAVGANLAERKRWRARPQRSLKSIVGTARTQRPDDPVPRATSSSKAISARCSRRA